MRPYRLLLVCLLVFAAATQLWVVDRDLPYGPKSDEVKFLLLAAQMAESGDLNPHWFGHPGSTFIYPFAAGLHLAHATSGADRGLVEYLGDNAHVGILVGRLLSVLYGVLGLWLVCLVGDRAFGEPVGLIGGWFALLPTMTADHVLMARTDGAGLFFGFLALWALLRLLDRPTFGAQVLAGVTLGLGIATRYFLAGLAPLLLVVEYLAWRRTARVGPVLLGLACVPLGLLLGAPFLLIDLPSVVENLAHEARGTHPGADGLDYLGNLTWYLGVALPRSVPWALIGLAGIGTLMAIVRRDVAPLLLVGFVAIFLGGISLASLHWGRWLIQILPLLALLAASGLVGLLRVVTTRLALRPNVATFVLALVVLAITTAPARAYVDFVRRQGTPSTADEGRAWVLANLSAPQRIAADLYTIPLQDTPFEGTQYRFSASEIAASPAELRRRGYDLVMVSKSVFGRFMRSPGRYPKEVAFYRELFRDHELVAEFQPGAHGRGSVIRIYRLVP